MAWPTAIFPSGIAGPSRLIVATNRLSTTLAASMTAGATTMIVASATGIVINCLLSIGTDGEIVFVSGVAGTTLTVARGFDGTTAVAHASGSTVSGYVDAFHHNALAAEIAAIETSLGVNLGTAAINSAYIFSPQTPGGSLIVGANSITLTPVPPGINGSDTFHYLYISGGTGTAEAVLIIGGTAVAGADSGTVIVTCAFTHSGAWTIQTATSGVSEAISSLGTSQGTVKIATGKWNMYAPARVQYSSQGIAGNGNGSYLNKMTATGNLLEFVPASGTTFYNYALDMLITTDGAVTPTGGAMIYTATLSKVGLIRGITMQSPWVGLQHFGQNWVGGDISVQYPQTSGSSYAFWLRGGQWNNLQAIQTLTTPGKGVGIFIDGPCDGLLICNSFIEGGFVDAVAINPYDALTTGRVIDVNFFNMMLDSFVRSGIVLEGAGEASLITFVGGHIENQLPDASNQPCVWFTNAVARHITIASTRFMYGNKEFILAGATAQSDLVFTGNQFLNGSYGAAGANAGVYSAVVITTPTHAVVTGNNFGSFDAAAVTHKYDLELNGVMTKSVVADNSFYGNLTGPLLKPTTMSTSAISGNAGYGDVLPVVTNYIASETGANNAIAGTLAGITLTTGLPVVIKLAHTLQIGANTFNLNAIGAVSIKSVRNPGNNIAVGYAATGTISLLYDSTGPYWLDVSQ